MTRVVPGLYQPMSFTKTIPQLFRKLYKVKNLYWSYFRVPLLSRSSRGKKAWLKIYKTNLLILAVIPCLIRLPNHVKHPIKEPIHFHWQVQFLSSKLFFFSHVTKFWLVCRFDWTATVFAGRWFASSAWKKSTSPVQKIAFFCSISPA